MIRNGKPFYIKGAAGNGFLNELKELGGNTIRLYDTTNLHSKLNKADSLGLAVVVDIPIPRFGETDSIYYNSKAMTEVYNGTQKFVEKYKKHPALLFWILGNELHYPKPIGNSEFHENFNRLLDLIHTADKNHPVTTTLVNISRTQVLSIQMKSPQLDFISFQSFGRLSHLKQKNQSISLLWNGPYLISEWGTNGPWESKMTSWEAPIEETSTKKAEHYRDRYLQFIKTIDDGRCLGSLAFHWGHKQERTHTWFNLLSENGDIPQATFELGNVWNEKKLIFKGPEINDVRLNGKRASESIILKPNEKAKADLTSVKNKGFSQYNIQWDIRSENWNYGLYAVEEKQKVIEGLIVSNGKANVNFVAPKKEGPYRLFVTVKSKNGYIATANVPFYILDPYNEQ